MTKASRQLLLVTRTRAKLSIVTAFNKKHCRHACVHVTAVTRSAQPMSVGFQAGFIPDILQKAVDAKGKAGTSPGDGAVQDKFFEHLYVLFTSVKMVSHHF